MASADNCAICLEQMQQSRMLLCEHEFCEACLDEWKETQHGQDQVHTCPLCKVPLNQPRRWKVTVYWPGGPKEPTFTVRHAGIDSFVTLRIPHEADANLVMRDMSMAESIYADSNHRIHTNTLLAAELLGMYGDTLDVEQLSSWFVWGRAIYRFNNAGLGINGEDVARLAKIVSSAIVDSGRKLTVEHLHNVFRLHGFNIP